MIDNLAIENAKKYPSSVERTSRKDQKVYFYSKQEVLELSVLSHNVFRIRFTPNGFFQRDFSYALKPNFVPDNVKFKLEDKEQEFLLSTQDIVCKIEKNTLRTHFFTKGGQSILEDNTGIHWESNRDLNGNFVYCSKKIQAGEYFFGLGDKPTELNLRGKRFKNWNSDKYGFEKEADPIYRDIPFYIGMHNGMAYGIFFDNTFRKFFDFGCEDDTVTSFWADGGEMNYYFLFGPKLVEVVQRFAWLTGTSELPPMWALGYHQSKWSYFPDSKVMDIAHEFRARKIPCDAIHIDIDYMDGFRCFTWDKSRFPNPANTIGKLKKMGFKAIPIIDPGIKIDENYHVFQQGLEGNYFCRHSEGDLLKAEVWPGICCFPDFTNPKVRTWWGELTKELSDKGILGIWNDMNEPTVFGFKGTFPDDVRHDYDGDNAGHRKAHNVYGMQMARASFEGMKKNLRNKRPFNLTRSGYAGVQRYSSVWTGDNVATWEHLWLANLQCQRFSISGVSFVGTDVGGFIGDPNGVLLARWIQLGIFHPLLRSHSSGDRGDKEPWVFGPEIENIVRKYVEIRYELLPYIYTAFWQHSFFGTPIIRPLCFLDQTDPETYYRMDEFGFGDSLVLCPITQPQQEGRWMYLPKGGWYNYWDETFFEGGVEVWVDAPLDTLPLFVKAGTVLPKYPVQQYVGEKRITTISLHVFHLQGAKESEFYEDAGEGYGYLKGDYAHSKFVVKGTLKSLTVTRQYTHSGFSPSYHRFEIYFHGLPFIPKQVEIDGKRVELKSAEQKYVYQCSIEAAFTNIKIT